jgi:predicted permease
MDVMKRTPLAFRLLLTLFPPSFRDTFADGMSDVFVEQRRASRGVRAVAGLWTRTIVGMAGAAWRERRDSRRVLAGGLPIGETLVADAHLAGRMLARSPLVSLAVVGAISLGIGGVTTIFSALNAIVLRPLPGAARGDRLVGVDRRTPDFSEGVSGSFRFYQYLHDSSRSLAGIAAWSRVPLTIVVGREAYAVSGTIASDNYFEVLGVRPAIGRFFEDDARRTPDGEPVLVVSHAFWKTRLNEDTGAVGMTLRVNGRPYRLIGVAPEEFRGVFTPLKIDAWVPLAAQSHVHPLRDLADEPWLWLFGRLRDGVGVQQARAELASVTATYVSTGGDRFLRYTSIRLTPLTGLPDDAREALLRFGAVLLCAAALVLVIASANVSSLLAVRAVARRREMGIRTALGATRWRLVRQLLTETTVLFLIGAGGGTLIAVAATGALERLPIPSDQGLSLELSPDGRVVVFAIAASLIAALLFGIGPALRGAGRSPMSLLRSSSSGGGRRTRTTSVLIVAQVACSFVLLTCAGLFARALVAGSAIDPGFDAHHVAIVSLNTDAFGYDEPTSRAFYEALRNRLASTTGMDAIGFADRLPLNMSNSGALATIERTDPGGGVRLQMRVETGLADAGYFDAVKIPIRAGRSFTASDDSARADVAVVNETFARRAWGDGGAVGRTFLVGASRITVVGVAADSKYSTLDEPATPFMYRPIARHWQPGRMLFMRVSGDPQGAAPIVQDAVESIDPGLPRATMTTLVREVDTALLPQRVAAIVTGILGGAGLLLTAIGLYGLVAYGVSLRLKEIGIRLALGARAADVVRLVVGHGLCLTAAGAAIGLTAASLTTRLIGRYLLNVSAFDVRVFAGAAGVLTVVTLCAAYLPARRARSADPLTVLRCE